MGSSASQHVWWHCLRACCKRGNGGWSGLDDSAVCGWFGLDGSADLWIIWFGCYCGFADVAK